MTASEHNLPVKLRPPRRGVYVMLFRVAALLPILTGCAWLLASKPSPPSIAVLSATTQSIRFKVTSPEMARLSLRGYAMTWEAPVADLGFGGDKSAKPQSPPKPLCLEGLATPDAGVVVTYERFGDDALAIEMRRDDGKPVAAFEIAKGVLPEGARKASWIRFEGTKASDGDDVKPVCPGAAMTMLPVYGFAEIGDEIRPASIGQKASYGTLLEGSLDIFAEAMSLPFVSGKGRIYPAASSIAIPPGSRIYAQSDGGPQEPWVGFALANQSNDFGLDVRLTTQARNISLARPGGGAQPETLAIGLFTQLTNDPVLMAAQVIAAFLFAAFQMVGSIVAWFVRRGPAPPA